MFEKVVLRVCDYIFVLRPLILIPAWSFYLLGAKEGMRNHPPVDVVWPSPSAFITLTAILASAYLLNQVFDRDTDEINRKCFYLSEGIFRVRTVLILAVVFFMIASVSFQNVTDARRAPLFLSLILALTYTLPPVRLCARPFVDMLANAAGYGGVAFVLGYSVFEHSWAAPLRASIPYVLLVAATFLHTAILDVDGDRASGKITTAVFLGARAASGFALVLTVLAVVSALLVGHVTALVVTGVALPVSSFAFFVRSRRASSLLVQANTGIITLAAAVAWPACLALILPLLALARYYYRKRFGIIYPGAPVPGSSG